jgi:hypothetical protein
MKFRRFWRARDDLSYLPRPDLPKAELAEATADRALREAKADSVKISRLSLRLRSLREENHFAELIRDTLAEHRND